MRGQTKKTWTEATIFWNEEVNLKCTCAVIAGQYGFGGNTNDTATTDAEAEYEKLVHDFLGMHLDYSETGVVKVSIIKYLQSA